MLNEVNDYIDADLCHSVHTSERKSFRGCRRRWSWVSREFYYPNITARPLEFGTAYHAALETYYAPETWQKNSSDRTVMANAAIMKFRKVVEEQRLKFIKNNGGQIDAEMDADYADRVELGLGMLRYHLFEIAPTVDEGLKPRYVEVKFEVPITDKDGNGLWCTCDTCWRRMDTWLKTQNKWDSCDRNSWKGLPVTYGGRIDAIMEMSDGRLMVYDWKTARVLSRGNEEFLLLEDQVVSYIWALKNVLGIDISGFIWHEQKKAFPREPEPNKNRRLGRLFSVSKQQDTSAELYELTVSENDPDAYAKGLYTEFIDWLKEQEVHFKNGNAYYQRYQVIKSDAELKNAGQIIFDEAADMTDPNLRIYPNPGRFHCGSCAFVEPCRAQNNDEDYYYALNTMFEKRTRHYWEEAKPTTEKKESTL